MTKEQAQEVVNYLNKKLAEADQKWKDKADRAHIIGFLEGSIAHAIVLLGGEIKK